RKPAFGQAGARAVGIPDPAEQTGPAHEQQNQQAEEDGNAIVFEFDIRPRRIDQHFNAQRNQNNGGQVGSKGQVEFGHHGAQNQQHAGGHQNQAQGEG